jgi:DNA modification methylase
MQCARVLRPNGKLCINSASMPIEKKLIPGPLRTLKCIPRDIWRSITDHTDLRLHDEIIWQKQNSKRPMFGSYPCGGNFLINNTTERIDVYCKPGKAPKFPEQSRAANIISQELWLELTQQSWWLYPEDVKRVKGHPTPFPLRLPARLIALYSRGACDEFAGEIVLDPFVGTGATCIAAKRMGRRYVGIDRNHDYLKIAEQRLAATERGELDLIIGRPGWPHKGARCG